MDITTKVIQSSSIIQALHWGKIIGNTYQILITKTRILEQYSLSSSDNSLYCILEQYISFPIHYSSLYSEEDSEILILASFNELKFLKFEEDYFKTFFSMTISRVKIQKLETWRNLLSVSLSCCNFFHLSRQRARRRAVWRWAQIEKYDACPAQKTRDFNVHLILFYFRLKTWKTEPNSCQCLPIR